MQRVPSVSLSSPGPSCNQRGKLLFVKKQEIRGKGLQQGQSILSKILLSLAVSSGQNPKEMLLVHSCSMRGKQPTHHPSAGGQNTKQGQQHTCCGQLFSINPSACLWRKDYCPRTPFRQEGKLNGSNSREEWRHFLCWSRWCLEVIFSYMFSKLWKESITFKGPLFSISWVFRNEGKKFHYEKNLQNPSIKLPLHYK